MMKEIFQVYRRGLLSRDELLQKFSFAYLASQDKTGFKKKLALLTMVGGDSNLYYDVTGGRTKTPPRRPQDDFLAGFGEEARVTIKKRMEARSDQLVSLI